jgi:hypothetical protein
VITALSETGPVLQSRRNYGLVVGRPMGRVFKRVVFRGGAEGYEVVHLDDSEHSISVRGKSHARFPPSHGP